MPQGVGMPNTGTDASAPPTVHLRRLNTVPAAAQDATRTRWSSAVRQGRMLRIAPGVYLHPDQWFAAAPWDRHVVALAAEASSAGRSLFCRESALALWGVPLLHVPTHLLLRDSARGRIGRRRAAPLTGAAPPAVVARMLAAHQHDDGTHSRPLGDRDLHPFPVRRLAPALPRGVRRPELDRRLRSGEHVLPRRTLDLSAFPWLHGAPGTVDVEPLAFTVLDTVAESRLPAGAVILDAVLAGRTKRKEALTREQLQESTAHLHTRARRHRWDQALAFADPAAESPGESAARAVMHELGFEPPELQREYVLPGGRRARVDFAWEGVVCEFDGMVKYQRSQELSGLSPAEALAAEKHREDGLRALGLRVVRILWSDILRPERLRQKLIRAGVPHIG